jgi:hypothetical protein
MEQDVTRNIEEQLSAFLDGELPDDELQLLVRRLERDEEHRATLARYAAIGSLLRKEPAQLSGDTLRQRLIVALGEEAGEIAVAPTGSRQTVGAKSFYGRRTLIAASVTVLALVGLYATNSGGPDALFSLVGQSQELASIESRPTGGPELADTRSIVSRPRAAGQRTQQASIAPERMTSYLVSHGEFSRSFQGSMVDSRIFVQQASFEQ